MWQLLKALWSISHADTARGGVWGQSSTLSELNWSFQTLVPWHLSKAFTLINMDLPLDKLSLGAEYQLIKKHFIFTHLQTKGIPWSGWDGMQKGALLRIKKLLLAAARDFFLWDVLQSQNTHTSVFLAYYRQICRWSMELDQRVWLLNAISIPTELTPDIPRLT